MNSNKLDHNLSNTRKLRVALVYDRVNKWGGAERVLLSLNKLFPNAPLFTSVYDRKSAPWADVFDVKTSFLQELPKASKNHELYASLMPLAFESFSFEEFDLVISVTSEAAKGIITKPKTCHICYCLTPTRYLWSGYSDYFANPILRTFSKPVVSYLKSWDLVAAQRPDSYVSISNEVSKRIKKYYGKESDIVYPPLSLEKRNKDLKREDFFLLVGRFVPYKRMELAIETFNKSGKKLKVVGVGRGGGSLKSIAYPNIEFLETVSDDDLISLYQRTQALIFPGIEDFGLAMVEAQSFGAPVIAFAGGGALEIVDKGKTGEFFEDQTKESLLKTLLKFDNKSYNSGRIRKSTEKFGFERFRTEFLNFVENKYEEYLSKT